jgi:hypothetical protein
LKRSMLGAAAGSGPAAGNGAEGSSSASGGAVAPGATAAKAAGPGSGNPGESATGLGSGMRGGTRAGGAPDFNQMLSRMPSVSLADLKKGDAVLIVATEGAADRPSTAITLLSGVEPILRSAPSASQAMMLTPWSLSGPTGDLAGQ